MLSTQDSLKRMLDALDAEIRHIEDRINTLILDNQQLQEKKKVMTVLKGVGETTA